jgi:hypothetical protein
VLLLPRAPVRDDRARAEDAPMRGDVDARASTSACGHSAARRQTLACVTRRCKYVRAGVRVCGQHAAD